MDRTLSNHPELEEGSQAWHVSRGLCEISSAADVTAEPDPTPTPAPTSARSRKPAATAAPKPDAEGPKEVVASDSADAQEEPESEPT